MEEKNNTGESKQRHRIQFDFSANMMERLDRLKQSVDASSYAEVVRDAIRVYEWFLEQRKDGNRFLLLKKDGRLKEVELIL